MGIRKLADKIQLDPVDVSGMGEEPLGGSALASLLLNIPPLDLLPTAVLYIPLMCGEQEVGELVAHPNALGNPDNLVAVVSRDGEKTRYALASIPPSDVAPPPVSGVKGEEKLVELAKRWISGGPRRLSALAEVAADLNLDKSGQTFYNFSDWLGICFIPPIPPDKKKHYVLLVGNRAGGGKERGTLHYSGKEDEYIYVSGDVEDVARLFGYCSGEWGWRAIIHNPRDGTVTAFIPRVVVRGQNHTLWQFTDTTVLAARQSDVNATETTGEKS